MKRLRDKRRVADMYIQASLSVFFVEEIIVPHETVTIYPEMDNRPEAVPQSSVLASTSQLIGATKMRFDEERSILACDCNFEGSSLLDDNASI